MIPLRALAAALTLLATAPLATSGELTQGPAIDATDLAKLLDITAVSMNYKQDTPFSQLDIGLVYKERTADGTLAPKGDLPYSGYPLAKPTNELNIKILFSSAATSIIAGSFSTRGKGVTPPPNANASSMNPPTRNDDGTYTLITYYDATQPNNPTIVGQVTLTLKTRD